MPSSLWASAKRSASGSAPRPSSRPNGADDGGGRGGRLLDASAALEALLPDSPTRFGLAVGLLEKIASNEVVAHVPLIFFNEVAAGCARAVRGGRITRDDARVFLNRLGAVPLNLSVEINPARDWFDRALKLNCQVADSAYLALALALRVPIATFDAGLATAAIENKAKLYFPR